MESWIYFPLDTNFFNYYSTLFLWNYRAFVLLPAARLETFSAVRNFSAFALSTFVRFLETKWHDCISLTGEVQANSWNYTSLLEYYSNKLSPINSRRNGKIVYLPTLKINKWISKTFLEKSPYLKFQLLLSESEIRKETRQFSISRGRARCTTPRGKFASADI